MVPRDDYESLGQLLKKRGREAAYSLSLFMIGFGDLGRFEIGPIGRGVGTGGVVASGLVVLLLLY